MCRKAKGVEMAKGVSVNQQNILAKKQLSNDSFLLIRGTDTSEPIKREANHLKSKVFRLPLDSK